jgi:hypothetical protein
LVTATGLARSAVCQPELVSLRNVALASSVPSAAHRWPTCVPVLFECLKNRSEVM